MWLDTNNDHDHDHDVSLPIRPVKALEHLLLKFSGEKCAKIDSDSAAEKANYAYLPLGVRVRSAASPFAHRKFLQSSSVSLSETGSNNNKKTRTIQPTTTG